MSEQSADDPIKIQKEILKWIKITSIPRVKKVLEETLSTDEERLAYHLSTGLTSREIASKVGVGFQTITTWWDKWYRLGIAEKVSAKRGQRGVRSFDLNDFGMPIRRSSVSKGRQESKGVQGET